MLSTNYLKCAKNQHFLDDLSNSGPAVRLYSEGRTTGPPRGDLPSRKRAATIRMSTPGLLENQTKQQALSRRFTLGAPFTEYQVLMRSGAYGGNIEGQKRER